MTSPQLRHVRKARRLGNALPGPRGWPGRGGGAAHHIEAAPEWRGTTVQACGLWPFAAGTGTPMVGVPLGHHLFSNETVCADPVSWFSLAGLLANPSCMLLGLPGLGKSTVGRRMALGLAGFGVMPVAVGDLKGEYRPLTEALGGRVVSLGRGEGTLNVLDPGSGARAAGRLVGEAKRKLLADIHGRRLTALAALIALNRRSPVSDHEETILSGALRVLDQKFAPGEATVHELIGVLEHGPEALRDVTLWRGEERRYRDAVDPLERSVVALTEGALGESFAGRTTVALELDRPLCVDISGIGEADHKLAAAALLACWSEGFAAISAAQALSNAGLEPQRNYFIIVDELWRVIRAGGQWDGRPHRRPDPARPPPGDRDVADHPHPKGPVVGPRPTDVMKAKGFVERVGMKVVGGLPETEIEDLAKVIGFSHRERTMVTEWSSPPSLDPDTAQDSAPAGRGKFLIKVGGRAGIPIRVSLTESELALNDTNARWAER